MSQTIRYRGRLRSGTAAGGTVIVDDLPAWVQEQYRKGWLRLIVMRGATPVAGIALHPDTGRRTWWAEADEKEYQP